LLAEIQGRQLSCVSVINALAVTLTYGELLMTNVLFVCSIWLFEDIPWVKHVSEKLVKYDRIDLIQPEHYEEMKADLEKRLGFPIIRFEVGSGDFLKDIAMVKVFYNGDGINSVNRMMKFPKEN
jgi:hypothetical protein